jgi:glutathione S-transferase
MGTMKVYQLAHSPYCIPITSALTACGVPFETIEVPNHDRALVIQLTRGAYYQVPVIEDNGRIVFESGPDTQDIAHYVDARHAGGRLFPPRWDGLQTILIPYLENDVEGITFKLCDSRLIDTIDDLVARTMVIRHKERRFGRGCVESWKRERESLSREATRLMAPFDARLEHSAFVLGDAPVYIDFLLFGVLGNLTFRDYNPLPPLAHLRRWHENMKAFRFS